MLPLVRVLSDFFGRWTYPVNPNANETITKINDIDLHNQSSVFYVHLGYTATTVDITLREALSYFMQALKVPKHREQGTGFDKAIQRDQPYSCIKQKKPLDLTVAK